MSRRFPVAALLLTAVTAHAQTVIETPYGWGGVGAEIKTEFTLESALNGVFEDFTGTAGTRFFSLPTAPGANFSSNIGTTGSPLPGGIPVVGSFSAPRAGQIVGTPFSTGTDDGRVGYEITFDTPQQYAGLQRIWTSETLTEFYNADGDLMFSFAGSDFVGFVAKPGDTANYVSRIQMDTTNSVSRQVGYSDDLIYGDGTLTIPEPRTYALMGLGAVMLGLFYWRRRRS